VPLPDAVAAASTVPARVITEKRVGRLRAGLPADVVVLGDSLEIERVLVGGDERVVC
jgi:N-acetylglucosamine-6-phosphate deacetylase